MRLSISIGLILGIAAAAAAQAQDVVILRDGQVRSGSLQACVSTVCQLDGQPVARADIAWIGLDGISGEPPAPDDSAADQVWLRNGGSLPGPVRGISLGAIAAGGESLDRPRVSWIYFGGAAVPAPPAAAVGAPPSPSAAAPGTQPTALPPLPLELPVRPSVPAGPAPPRFAAEAELLLNEVGLPSPGGEPPYVELLHRGRGRRSLDGVALENATGQRVPLPPGLALGPGELLLVRFDGADGVEPGLVHAAPGFLEAAGMVELRSAGALLDRVAWGRGHPGGVRLSRGGVVGEPAPGSSLGRLAGAAGRTSGDWILFEPEEATPGAPNPRPRVSVLLPPSGAAVVGTPRLAWYPLAGAASYRVQLAAGDDFAAPLADREVEQPEVELPGLAPGRYWWRVQARANDGTAAPWSEPALLTVLAPPTQTSAHGSGRRPAAGLAFASTGSAASTTAAQEPDAGNQLDLPPLAQRKDTRMLQIENDREHGPHAWDAVHPGLDRSDPADNMNCVPASVAMMASWYGGDLSQDRINYEIFQNEAPGPQWDLNYGVGYSLDRIAAALTFALGRAPTIEMLDGDSLFTTALIRARIDQGIPMLVALRRRHAVVLVGWAPQSVPQPDGTFEPEELLIVNDPWIGVWLGPAEAVLAGARVFSLATADTATSPAGVEARSDEPEVHQDGDGDGVVDFDETHRFGTHPGMRDTDQDGVDDKEDIRAGVFDERHGYAFFGPGRDFDGDGVATELDPDSDDGGCRDGAEDANGDGRWEREGELDNFADADDACLSGEWRLVIEQRVPSGDGGFIHQRHVLYATTQATVDEGRKITGRGYAVFTASGISVSPWCPATYSSGPVEWRVELTGEAHPLPDGDGVVVGIAASQPESPPIDLTWRHSCPVALEPHVVTVQWPGASGIVVDGVLETRHDMPIHGGTLTVTQTLRQVGAGGPLAP